MLVIEKSKDCSFGKNKFCCCCILKRKLEHIMFISEVKQKFQQENLKNT